MQEDASRNALHPIYIHTAVTTSFRMRNVLRISAAPREHSCDSHTSHCIEFAARLLQSGAASISDTWTFAWLISADPSLPS